MTKRTQILATRFLILLLALSSAFLLLGNSVSANEPVAVTTHVVQPGDTLWTIAADVTGADEDIRAVISEVRRFNDLESSALFVGQVLSIPLD